MWREVRFGSAKAIIEQHRDGTPTVRFYKLYEAPENERIGRRDLGFRKTQEFTYGDLEDLAFLVQQVHKRFDDEGTLLP